VSTPPALNPTTVAAAPAPAGGHLLVIDGEAPWVRSLFTALPAGWYVHFLCPRNPMNPKATWGRGQWQPLGERARWKQVLIPGWTRAPGWSARRVAAAAQQTIAQLGGVRAVVYTLPQYADLPRHLARGRVKQLYYAHDPFAFYDWDAPLITVQENQLMASCDAVFAVSRQLMEDLSSRCKCPVLHQPNGTSDAWLKRLEPGPSSPPIDLAPLRHPIIGVIGQANRTYDWPLLARLCELLPEASLVFVGPVWEEPDDIKTLMNRVLRRSNVHVLGRKEHDDLPDYLRHFDVCLSPLAMTEHNHRRCPLRLFDYLASGKPVVSTAVREALELRPHIRIGSEATELALAVREALRERPAAAASRRRYAHVHTWSRRGERFVSYLKQLT
jgi:glycosyltransferase involved in cell wall biosynthesis